MSVNLPPNPNVATFNNSYWIFNTTQLTQAEADLLYLKYPVAQGAENLQTTNVNGIMTCNDDVNFADGANITTFNQTLTNFSITSTNPPLSTATQPASNDSSTKMPTTAWVQGAITGSIPASLLGLNNIWTGTQSWVNTAVGSLTSLATQPASSDNSTNIPTTAWVQSAISAIASLLGLNNTWTGTQNWTNTGTGSLTSSATQPASSDNSTKIPTTAWVQSVISAIPSLLGLNNTWTGTQNWTNTGTGSLTSSATQPASSDNSTKIPTTAWVQTAISAIPTPSSQFQPTFHNFSNYQTGTSGYSQGAYINWGSGWGALDYVIIRVRAQVNWNISSGEYNSYASTSGELIIRPFYAPAGAIGSLGSPNIFWSINSGSVVGSVKKLIYYTGVINNGTQNYFFVYGNGYGGAGAAGYIQLMCASPTTPNGWTYTSTYEYMVHSTSGASITFTDGVGTNNSLP